MTSVQNFQSNKETKNFITLGSVLEITSGLGSFFFKNSTMMQDIDGLLVNMPRRKVLVSVNFWNQESIGL